MKICWNLTNKCNANCKHCFRNFDEEPISFSENVKILEKLEGIVDSINFSGGEPFLYPNFENLLKKAKRLGFICSITTNGKNLNIQNINSIVKYINKITFSLDYLDDNLNVIYGRGENYFKHIKELIIYLNNLYPDKIIKINTVAMKTNYAFLDDMYNELQKLNINIWKIMEFCPLRGNFKENYNSFYIEDKIKTKIKSDIEKYNRIHVFFKDKNEVQNQIIISPSGNLSVGNNDNDVIILNDLQNKKKKTIKAVLLDNIKEKKIDIYLNLYKTFYEVARAGNITAVSKKLYMSQPAISKAISKLENDLQVKLFERTQKAFL